MRPLLSWLTPQEREGATTSHLPNAQRRLLSLVPKDKLLPILSRMLDEDQFLGPYGLRSLSKEHLARPYRFSHGEACVWPTLCIAALVCCYVGPHACGCRLWVVCWHTRRLHGNAQVRTGRVVITHVRRQLELAWACLDAGKAAPLTWLRGVVITVLWHQVNFLMIESLQRFDFYFGDSLKVEFPTGSGHKVTLWQVSQLLSSRLADLFRLDGDGVRCVLAVMCGAACDAVAREPSHATSCLPCTVL